MESTGGLLTALASQTTTFPHDPFADPPPHSHDAAAGMMLSTPQQPSLDVLHDHAAPVFDEPDDNQHRDHLQDSHVRQSTEQPPNDLLPAADDALAANMLTNDTHPTGDEEQTYGTDYLADDFPRNPMFNPDTTFEQMENNNMIADQALQERPILNQNLPDIQNACAFAKLVFPDGDFLITTHDVMLGRNMEYFEQVKRDKKAAKKAQQALEVYAQEPSQPSQPEEQQLQGHGSLSSQSLEGRPAPPSNFSEHGGVVTFADEHAERRERRKVRRSLQFSKSTSTTSVAPANLHPSLSYDENGFGFDGEPEFRTYAVVPIHSQVPEDIGKISKEHLMFSYDFPGEQWQLKVVGNRAMVNDDMFERGEVIRLEHNDEIMAATVRITFKLPDNPPRSPGLTSGVFSADGEDLEGSEDERRGASTSPVGRISNAFEDVDDDERPKPTIKLKLGGPQHKSKGRAKDVGKSVDKTPKKPKAAAKKKDSPTEPKVASPDEARKSDKSKIPPPGLMDTAKEPAAEPAEVGAAPNESPSMPPLAPQIEPGSALEHIPTGELPQKRKGPGRPPKNGIVSKRDMALVKRKQKEYEKQGKEPPTFDGLVAEVRRENKARELQARLAQSGQPVPPDVQIVQSIETDASVPLPPAPKPPTTPATGAEPMEQTSATPAEPARKSSPKPKRTAKSPSPMKPEAEYAEEELRKPNGTYVHILDEVLRDHPTGKADLQEIYDRIMKRYPFYKYRVNTTGWQSSVRHNLLQNERFKENGRSGKGKLWSINPDVPLEKEKKKRATPPRQPMPMVNGQYVSGSAPHYGQQQGYGNPYVQPQANGHPQFSGAQSGPSGQYSSPYAQGGYNGPPGQHPQGNVAGQQATAHMNGQQHRPPQQNQPEQKSEFDGLVGQIMKYRTGYLGQFTQDTAQFKAHEAVFVRCTHALSDQFHKGKRGDDIMSSLPTDEDKRVFGELQALYRKYLPAGSGKGGDSAAQNAGGGAEGTQTVGEAVESGAAAARAVGQEPGASVPPPQAGPSSVGAPSAAVAQAVQSPIAPPMAVQQGSASNVGSLPPQNRPPPTAQMASSAPSEVSRTPGGMAIATPHHAPMPPAAGGAPPAVMQLPGPAQGPPQPATPQQSAHAPTPSLQPPAQQPSVQRPSLQQPLPARPPTAEPSHKAVPLPQPQGQRPSPQQAPAAPSAAPQTSPQPTLSSQPQSSAPRPSAQQASPQPPLPQQVPQQHPSQPTPSLQPVPQPTSQHPTATPSAPSPAIPAPTPAPAPISTPTVSEPPASVPSAGTKRAASDDHDTPSTSDHDAKRAKASHEPVDAPQGPS